MLYAHYSGIPFSVPITAAKLSDEELELENELIVLNYDDNTPILYDEELQWSEDKEDYISVEVPQEEWDYVDNPEEDIKIFASELEYTEKMTMEEVSHEATKEKKSERYEAFKNILHTDQSKTLLKPVYKNIKEAIYTQLLYPDDNEIKDNLQHLEELSKELETCDYTKHPPLVAEIQNTIYKVIREIETPELTNYFEQLKDYLKSQVEETVPKEVQEDVTKLIENMRNGGLYMPYNYTIFAMGAETKATYGKAVAWGIKDDIKNVNHLVYQNFYEVLSHNKIKREASPIYQLVKQLINAPTPNTPKEELERKQLHTKILAEFRQNSDFDKAYHQLENCLSYCSTEYNLFLFPKATVSEQKSLCLKHSTLFICIINLPIK